MENGHDEIEDDIFEHHMHEIDERETPRWEMSEEEPDGVEEQTRILNCDGLPSNKHLASAKKPEILPNGQTWDDVSEQDSVKDFTGPYREQEAKYMERTDEAIFSRASEEHIRQPIPYDDVDSVKNFGSASQGISRIPSEEELCLSPPWPPGYEVDDGITLEDRTSAEIIMPTDGNNCGVDELISQAKQRADARNGFTWHGQNSVDFTQNYAEEGSLENSRRPSSEDISLTPPWLDTDKESSCKDSEEQLLDDNELLSKDPPTTSAILTSAPTTTHVSATRTGPLPTVSEPSQSPLTLKRATTIPADHASVPGSTSESKPPQRRVQQVQSSDRGVCVKPVLATRPQQMNQRIDVYNNSYLSPRTPYKLTDPYYDPPKIGAIPLPYRVDQPCASNAADGRLPFRPPGPTAEFVQQQSYNKMPAFISQQFRPRAQVVPGRSQMNPVNPAYSSIPRPFPNARYFNPTHAPSAASPRQPANIYETSYYPPQADDWQYHVRQPQMVISSQTPPINAADFAADEVINFAVEPKRICPPSERPRGVPPPDMHRNLPASDRSVPDLHRNIPVSEMPRNVPEYLRGLPDYHRDVTEFQRDLAVPEKRRGGPAKLAASEYPNSIPLQCPVPGYPTKIPNSRMYSVFPDDVTTVSDSDISPVMSTHSGSQSSLAVYCHTPHRDGIETASVMSFTSGASARQDLDSKIDQVRNLLAVIDTRDAKETAQTLYSLSNSKENCQAMRLSGCLPLLIQLQHKSKSRDPRVAHEVRVRSAQTIRNIVRAGAEDKRGKREARVLQLIEVVRGYCTELRYGRNVPSASKLNALSNALAAIMKLSFEEEHRVAIGDLGGVEAIGEFLELSRARKDGDLSLDTNLRKYASMALTNMTFEKTRSKALLGNSTSFVKALLKNLDVLDDEDLIQVSASVLRNLSCKSDERSKLVLQECNSVSELMVAAQRVSNESTLRTILYAVWNLSAHSAENKLKICETHKALGFLVQMLAYKSPSNSLTVVESSSGILRNVSSQIAVKSEYRAALREHDCFKFLLANLRSPSLRVVGNACGILWNLSARCETDQGVLLKMGALGLLKPLVTSKNKSISRGAGAAIKNLQNHKTANPGHDSPSGTRKLNGVLRKENGSPLSSRNKGKSRDARSLNSFTGSADDMSKEHTKQNSRSKENAETDLPGRSKGVRWSDDKHKEAQRKTSNDRRRGDSPPIEHKRIDPETANGVNEVASDIGQLRIGEKSRGKMSEGSYSSPRSKKKHPGRSAKGKDGRRGTTGGRDDDPEVYRSEGESPRSSPMPLRHNSRTTRVDSDENDRDLSEDRGSRDLNSQRCQCADESEVWVKRNKICSHCQKRRISHSSDSTSGSRRSSYESLSSSNRQLNRKETLTNGTGYVTAI